MGARVPKGRGPQQPLIDREVGVYGAFDGEDPLHVAVASLAESFPSMVREQELETRPERTLGGAAPESRGEPVRVGKAQDGAPVRRGLEERVG